LALLLSLGVVELVSAGGVLGGVDDDVEGGVLGVADVEPDDIDPLDVDGVRVDPDGDGVTTGGVLGEVPVDVSRLQPAIPTASPAHSSAINVLFITVSR
jgi:hypothetical protein